MQPNVPAPAAHRPLPDCCADMQYGSIPGGSRWWPTFHHVRSLDLVPFPLYPPGTLLSRPLRCLPGAGPLQFPIVEEESGGPHYTSRVRPSAFPNDPLRVAGLCSPRPGISLSRRAGYQVQLWYNDLFWAQLLRLSE